MRRKKNSFLSRHLYQFTNQVGFPCVNADFPAENKKGIEERARIHMIASIIFLVRFFDLLKESAMATISLNAGCSKSGLLMLAGFTALEILLPGHNVVFGAVAGAAVGLFAGRDKYGRWAPVSGLIGGAIGGAVIGALSGLLGGFLANTFGLHHLLEPARHALNLGAPLAAPVLAG